MSCEQWSEQISAWVDGVLSEVEKAALEAHMRTCNACRQTANELMELKRRLRTVPVPPPRYGMWERLLRHIRWQAQRKRFVTVKSLLPLWLGAAASVVLLSSAILLLTQKPKVSQTVNPQINVLASYHADTVSLALSDNPICHLVASAELSEAESHE